MNWSASSHYKHTKLFYESPNKNKSKYILKMGTNTLSTWIKSITGHNNLAYFQSKLNSDIDPTCRLCLQANETLHHLMTDCEARYNFNPNGHHEKQNTSPQHVMVCERRKYIYKTSTNSLSNDV